MPGPFPIDPFTQVHQAIWAALLAYQPWTALVPPGARIGCIVGSPNVPGLNPIPLMGKLAATEPGDVPEVRITQSNYDKDPRYSNSMTNGYRQNFQVQMSSASAVLDITPLNKLKWATNVALEKSGQALGLPSLIRQWEIDPSHDNPTEKETGMKQWIAVQPITVHWFIDKRTMNSL